MHHSGSTVLGTVIIVDDDPSVRASLERMLRLEGHRPLSYDCAETFLASTLPDTPACVLLDVLLPDHDGFSVQQSVARTHRHIPIIFLSGHGDVPMTVRAMKGGAADLLTKPYDSGALLASVQGALEASQRLIREANVLRAESAALAVLTSREQEVFWGVVAGMSNKVIASELGISEKTVKVHRHNLMRKVGHSSVADLVRMGERIKSAQISPNRTATLVRIGD